MRRLLQTAPADLSVTMDWPLEGDEFEEEAKLRDETRKIMELPGLPFVANCVRVPVLVGHCQAIWLETEEPLSTEGARDVLAGAPAFAWPRLRRPRATRSETTTCSSAAFAATRRSKTASSCSPRATTSARARR